jgi:lysophospholipase L1-like esterase
MSQYPGVGWADGPNGGTPLDAHELSIMDQGIADEDVRNPASPASVLLANEFQTPAQASALYGHDVRAWAPNTPYIAGQAVVSPSGDLVTAAAGFTSAVTYNAANWNLSTTYAQPGTNAGVPFYNVIPANFTHWRKAVAGVRAGLANAKVLCVGDSTTWGVLSGAANPPAASYPAVLTNLLNSYVAPAVGGLVIPPSNLSGTDNDSRWVFGTGWAKNSNAWGTGAAIKGSLGATGSLTFTPGINCDTFEIYYLAVAGQGTVNISVDGGAATPINTNASSACRKITVTAAAGSAHVLTFSTVTVNDVFIAGVDAYLSTSKTIRVGNAGVPSSTTAGWDQDGGYGGAACIKGYAPDLTIISLGINDASASVTEATWQANMQTIITAALASGDVILASPVPSNSTGGNPALEATYQGASLAFAQSNSIGYFDLFSRFGSWATMNGLGMMGDNLHPNGLGYADFAAGVHETIRAVS